ncbi:hypothetical protein L3Q82_007274 [Scortum barcoo]|uniref:Uncharacterized protein n=1 Tax=Scortum barcoo TaxID=214431 RepID=A0ACB8WSZ6_9TELE|nr:hypothetical protein L3Q82_007274 [Scortum barcoo]
MLSSQAPVFIMFHQLTDQTANGSCQALSSVCNKSTDGNALQLPTFSTAAQVRVIITFTLCAVASVCNLAVLWAASNGGKRKSHVRILIMNLTVADLLVTFIVMPMDAVWNITVQWQAGDVACRLLMFLKLVAMYSCAFMTVVISLDRQSAILNPLGISEAKRKSKIMLTVAWTMSVILSLPQIDGYCQAKQAAARAVLQAKTREEFSEAMEEDYRLALKKFWQTVQAPQKGGKQYSANTVYSLGAELVTSAKYFEDLLNPTNLPSTEEAEAEDSEVDSSITQAEVTEVVCKLLGGKAPRVDEICLEYLKSLDVVSWLTHLCSIAWSLPREGLRQGTGEENSADSRTLGFRRNNAVFRPGRGTLDQLYTLHRVLEGLWEFAQPVHMCFVDLEKAFDRQDLQYVLWWFAAECEAAGMRISTSKSKAPRGGVPGMSHQEEAPWEDPGETMSLGWPGNASESPWKSWWKWLGQSQVQ